MMLKKKYYDGFTVHDILNKHLDDGHKILELLTAFADADGVDAVEVVRCENCPHSKEWVEQARQWTVWCEHFDMSTPRDWFCAIPVREKEGKDDE